MELSLAEKSCILTARRRGIVDHAGLALAGVVTGPINRQFVAFTFALFGASVRTELHHATRSSIHPRFVRPSSVVVGGIMDAVRHQESINQKTFNHLSRHRVAGAGCALLVEVDDVVVVLALRVSKEHGPSHGLMGAESRIKHEGKFTLRLSSGNSHARCWVF